MPNSAPKSSKKIFSGSLKWLGLCFVGTLAAVYIVIDTATSEGFVQTLGAAGETLETATDEMLVWAGLLPKDNTYVEGEVTYEIGEGKEAGDSEVLGETDSAVDSAPVKIDKPVELALAESTNVYDLVLGDQDANNLEAVMETTEDPRTSSVWLVTGEGVRVYPHVWTGKDNVYVDFEAKDFSNIEYIYYNLQYDSDELGSVRGAEGHFLPALNEPSGEYDGLSYYRRRIVLGLCSDDDCVYHKNPRNVTLVVNTKMKSGPVDQYTQKLVFPDDQFSF